MEKRFLDKVEDNVAVRIWAETTQQEKGDSLTEGYVSELWDFTRISSYDHPNVLQKADEHHENERTVGYKPDQAKGRLLSKRVTPVLAILAKTFRSLNACRRAGEGRFIGCAQLVLAWFHSHFWKVEKVSYRIFSKNYAPLKELVATPRRDDITEEKYMTILQNLREEDVE
ncbi:hypothetical protein CXB51_007045 [Gossypium anomalum]|uniref:Uncharacterized protein n=1 Tax=Gossypium anomalum TaxID=47600 RepID=A0A8J6D7A0_9ROSI|nr:hypothetical protein CXB51_007045 [Gossypium anomalum]